MRGSKRNSTHLAKKRIYRVERLEHRLLLAADLEYRSYDGTGNNWANEDWGAVDTALLRLTTPEYGDGVGSLAERLDSSNETINPRTVSNLVFDQPPVDVLNDRGLTSFTFQWGQFLDHDMGLTEDTPPVGVANEYIGEEPEEDISFFVPTDGTETELDAGTIIPMLRSRFELDEDGVRQQINQITSYIDASNVYGSDNEKAAGLRAGFGGFLLTSDGENNNFEGTGDFLPFNTLGLENAAPPTSGTGFPLDPEDLFVAGDVRSNEQPGLATLHTLFVREHNYRARRLAEEYGYESAQLGDPQIDERLYQEARRIVSAEVQAITYNEFLPALLGPDQLESFRGYDRDVNAGIANIFSGSLYRVGHTMLPNNLLLLNEDGTGVNGEALGATVTDGQVALRDAFFNPQLITEFGIEPYLKGLAEQQIQEIDNLIVDSVRNLLFDPPAATDLGATNLQRGRDHGLPDYNQARVDFTLTARTEADFSADVFLISSYLDQGGELILNDAGAKLAAAYESQIDNLDPFAGGISEAHIPGGSVGELIHQVMVDQFTRLREGDRFYFENSFRGPTLAEIQNTRLSDIIRRNTSLQEVQDEVFRANSVFTFRAPEGNGSLRATLRVANGEMQLVAGNGNNVLASRAVDATDIVVLYGTSKNDKIRIDASVAEVLGAAGVQLELHGGGGSDQLMVDAELDTVVVEPTEIRIDGLSVYYGNWEKVKLLPASGLQQNSFAATAVADARDRAGEIGRANALTGVDAHIQEQLALETNFGQTGTRARLVPLRSPQDCAASCLDARAVDQLITSLEQEWLLADHLLENGMQSNLQR